MKKPNTDEKQIRFAIHSLNGVACRWSNVGSARNQTRTKTKKPCYPYTDKMLYYSNSCYMYAIMSRLGACTGLHLVARRRPELHVTAPFYRATLLLESRSESRLLSLDMLVEPRQMAKQIIPHMLRLRQTMALPWVAHKHTRHPELPQSNEVLLGLRNRHVHVLHRTRAL